MPSLAGGITVVPGWWERGDVRSRARARSRCSDSVPAGVQSALKSSRVQGAAGLSGAAPFLPGVPFPMLAGILRGPSPGVPPPRLWSHRPHWPSRRRVESRALPPGGTPGL